MKYNYVEDEMFEKPVKLLEADDPFWELTTPFVIPEESEITTRHRAAQEKVERAFLANPVINSDRRKVAVLVSLDAKDGTKEITMGEFIATLKKEHDMNERIVLTEKEDIVNALLKAFFDKN